MIKDVRTTRIPIDESTVQVTTLLMSSIFTSEDQAETVKMEMLRDLYETPQLLLSGGKPFERLEFFRSGSQWIIRLDALVDA